MLGCYQQQEGSGARDAVCAHCSMVEMTSVCEPLSFGIRERNLLESSSPHHGDGCVISQFA